MKKREEGKETERKERGREGSREREWKRSIEREKRRRRERFFLKERQNERIVKRHKRGKSLFRKACYHVSWCLFLFQMTTYIHVFKTSRNIHTYSQTHHLQHYGFFYFILKKTFHGFESVRLGVMEAPYWF